MPAQANLIWIKLPQILKYNNFIILVAQFTNFLLTIKLLMLCGNLLVRIYRSVFIPVDYSMH